MSFPSTNRRQFLHAAGASVAAASLAGGSSSQLAYGSESDAPAVPLGKAKHCIMIWLSGGAAQIDTWDPKRKGDAKAKKPGSYYDSIDTAVAGVQVCEHLSRCAKILDRFNILRTVNHDVIDEHGAATNRMHTGRPTTGTVVYPSVGSIVAHQLGPVSESVPAYILMGYPSPTRGPGFLGTKGAYVYLTDTESGPSGFARPKHLTPERLDRRQRMLAKVRAEYRQRTAGGLSVADYDATVSEAMRLSGPEFMSVFQLDREPAELRQSYGGEFGQRCLLARRLLQAGVRFIEVSHNTTFTNGTGWDTHNEGQLKQHLLIDDLDQGLSGLVLDLERLKMLDDTLIVVASEFGRPAGFDGGGGRNHYGACFSVVMAGGGLQNGKMIGETNELAEQIVDRPVSVADMHATIHNALGIDPHLELYAGERPVPITDGGVPIRELFV
ncbi:DUF1501 domain-containing protein [Candidatus Laterigemmans baculatus]|uniref:DUF1501 domain-containing protein n=1 Tax=Candidatus Laterigemmans baculatus TaxID=2770505 RepID=UPI0013DBD821|nr:DUF1501 domain-containing protein [Candidatus Laterigemmans baculatus]